MTLKLKLEGWIEMYGFQEIKINGIIIDICRLAPVAIMGEDDR
ncbi:hypothetical protein [Anaerobacillus alkalidiazotrophicus]|nr:hypothetical protein [Anaerobacillus alkalidiazotrophicus]